MLIYSSNTHLADLSVLQADGGSWGSRPVSWNNGRRRGTVLPEAQFFRTALSDTSNTCCPPLNVPHNTLYTDYSTTQITPLGLFHARHKSQEMCFRKLFFKHDRNGNLKPRNDVRIDTDTGDVPTTLPFRPIGSECSSIVSQRWSSRSLNVQVVTVAQLKRRFQFELSCFSLTLA